MAQYGQIIQNQTAGAINHALGTIDFCAFLTQFANGGVGANGTPRMYVSGQSSTQVVLANPGAAMAADVILASPMSVYDVGPIVVGATRNNTTQVTPYLASKRLWSYRSLHQFVQVQLVQGETFGTIDITHRLNTTFTTMFASPRFDPWDGTGGLMWYTSAIPSADTIRLRVERQDGGAFATASRWVNFDVMVIATADPTALFPSSPFSVLSYVPPLGGALSRLPNYHEIMAREVVLQAGSNLTHNLNQHTPSVLMQMDRNPVATSVNYIYTRDFGGTGSRTVLACTGNHGGASTDILFVCPHSRLMGP